MLLQYETKFSLIFAVICLQWGRKVKYMTADCLRNFAGQSKSVWQHCIKKQFLSDNEFNINDEQTPIGKLVCQLLQGMLEIEQYKRYSMDKVIELIVEIRNLVTSYSK